MAHPVIHAEIRSTDPVAAERIQAEIEGTAPRSNNER